MAAAERYAQARSGTITFAVVDEAGRLHGYHAHAVAPSASVLKAMLLVAYLRRADVRGRDLEQWERDLLRPMIQRSDNAAASRMVGLVGEARLDALAKAAGMEHFRLHWPIWGESEITPRGQALFFHRIDRLVPARHRRYAMHLLATVVPSQRWGVGRVPHGLWNLYFKGGWGSGTGLVDHQVALYRAGGERFSLALFTRFDPNHEYGKETLRGLATRLLRGVPAPGGRLPRAGRAALSRAAVVTARPDCAAVTIRPHEGGKRTFATGAASCTGFQVVSAGARALWSWPDSGESHLAAADYGIPGACRPGRLRLLGSARASRRERRDPRLRARERGVDCGRPRLSRERRRSRGGRRSPRGRRGKHDRASRSGHVCRRADPGRVRGSRGGRTRRRPRRRPLSRLRGPHLARVVPNLDGKAPRQERGRRAPRFPPSPSKSPGSSTAPSHALRVRAAGSGRTWTVWRPAEAQLGARLLGNHISWVEADGGRSRLWA